MSNIIIGSFHTNIQLIYCIVAFHATPEKDDGYLSVVVFEYRNVEVLGVEVSSSDGISQKKYICDDSAITNQLCTADHRGQFIVNNSTGESLYAPIYTTRIDLKSPGSIHYPVNRTGYYCVSTFLSNSDSEFTAAAVFQNAFGQLPATQIPKLVFFGFAALAYALVLALWMFAYIQHRSDILPVQNYITAICGFLVVEMIVIWGYYDFTNRHGDTAGSKVYLVILSVFNSFRNAFTFFLLLIVCLGYGVVKPSLGNLMWKCRTLAGAHFVFAVAWTISSYMVPPDNLSPLILLVVLPLSLTMAGFYIWILSSLTQTIRELVQKKQHVKAEMYKNLWRLLLGSIIVIFAFLFINSLIFASESTMEFITRYWQIRWFILDGWLNVVYFADFCLIAYIWRPTANNRRFAMSTQLAQDESEAQEFEIGSLRESFDEEENVGYQNDDYNNFQSNSQTPDVEPPQYSPPADGSKQFNDSKKTGDGNDKASGAQASASRTIAGPSATAGPSSSTAKDTVFSVADSDEDPKGYDKWDESDDSLFGNDDEDDAEAEDYEHSSETQGLTKKNASDRKKND